MVSTFNLSTTLPEIKISFIYQIVRIYEDRSFPFRDDFNQRMGFGFQSYAWFWWAWVEKDYFVEKCCAPGIDSLLLGVHGWSAMGAVVPLSINTMAVRGLIYSILHLQNLKHCQTEVSRRSSTRTLTCFVVFPMCTITSMIPDMGKSLLLALRMFHTMLGFRLFYHIYCCI